MTNTMKELINKTPIYIRVENEDDDKIHFYMSDGKQVTMSHDQDCCESVQIEDINGDLNKLLYHPITRADEKVDNTAYEDFDDDGDRYTPESCTYTFYTLASRGGYVDIRWYGESNGYYSESVDIEVTDYNINDLPSEVLTKLKSERPELLI